MIRIILGLLLLPYSLSASQNFHLNPGSKIQGVISSKELNRIAVKDDRISQIFGVSGHFVVESDENHGQIFIKSTDSGNKDNLALTIVTEKGITQDLYLKQKDISSQFIELQHKTSNTKKAEIWEKLSPFKQTLVKLMQCMIRGQSVSGYEVQINEQSRDIWSDIRINQLQIFSGSKLQGIVFKITNIDKVSKFLHEKRFKFFKNIAAIAIENNRLEPGESTKLYVIKNV
jgi:type-F conjugative transfer system secretin TraK